MADPVEGTITALPPLIGSLSNGMLFETANSGVSQSVTAEQIAEFAVGPDGVVPETRTISTPNSGGLSGGGTLASNLTLSMDPNVLTAKTIPVAADSVVINDSSGNTPAKTTLSDFYKSIAGLTNQMAPVPTTYSIVLYDSADGNTYQSTLQDAFVVSGTLPVGGTTGQALVKSSDADFETEWSNSTGSVTSVTVSAGTGLSGGGTITSAGTITLALANTAVTASSYGSSSASPTFTVDAQGRLTAAANATITPTAIGAVPTTRTITAGTGLTGGGDLSANRTLAIDVTGVSAATYGDSTHVSQVAVNTQGQITSASSVAISLASLGAVPTSRTLTAGTGLTGGGTLAADRTFTLADTAVTPGSYGTASTVGTFTVDQQGRITAATPTTITPAAIGAVPTTRAVNTATGLTGGGALSSDLTLNYNITALANKASPSSVSDLVLIWDAAASAYKNATVGSIASGGTVSSFNTRTGAVVPASGDYSLAQLAMTTGSRILATDASGVSGASAITFASSNAGFPGNIDAVGEINIRSAARETSLYIEGTIGDIGIRLNNIGTGGHAYEFLSSNSTSGLPAGSLSIYDVTVGADRLTITSAGNVGIGTTTPLPVVSAFASGLTIANSVSGHRANLDLWTTVGASSSDVIGGQISFINGPAGSVPSAIITSQFNGTTSGTGNLAFYTSAAANTAAERMRITHAGNVGIGTTSPSRLLTVAGNVNISGQIVNDSSIAGGTPLPYVSVKVFGVVGDGSTDDTASFQAAIDAMAANSGAGGVLLVPPGVYFVPGGITLKHSVQIWGSGHEQGTLIFNNDTATVLTFDDTTFYAAAINCCFNNTSTNPSNNVVHCTANGLGTVLRDCNLIGGFSSLFMESTDCLIENCVMHGYTYGVFSTGANWYIRDKIDQSDNTYTATAAYFQTTSVRNAIQENHFFQCDLSGTYDYSVIINDASFGQALTVFEGCVFSSPIDIQNQVWTCLSACEVGENINLNSGSSGGSLTVIGSYGFGGVHITGGSSHVVNTGNFGIT